MTSALAIDLNGEHLQTPATYQLRFAKDLSFDVTNHRAGDSADLSVTSNGVLVKATNSSHSTLSVLGKVTGTMTNVETAPHVLLEGIGQTTTNESTNSLQLGDVSLTGTNNAANTDLILIKSATTLNSNADLTLNNLELKAVSKNSVLSAVGLLMNVGDASAEAKAKFDLATQAYDAFSVSRALKENDLGKVAWNAVMMPTTATALFRQLDPSFDFDKFRHDMFNEGDAAEKYGKILSDLVMKNYVLPKDSSSATLHVKGATKIAVNNHAGMANAIYANAQYDSTLTQRFDGLVSIQVEGALTPQDINEYNATVAGFNALGVNLTPVHQANSTIGIFVQNDNANINQTFNAPLEMHLTSKNSRAFVVQPNGVAKTAIILNKGITSNAGIEVANEAQSYKEGQDTRLTIHGDTTLNVNPQHKTVLNLTESMEQEDQALNTSLAGTHVAINPEKTGLVKIVGNARIEMDSHVDVNLTKPNSLLVGKWEIFSDGSANIALEGPGVFAYTLFDANFPANNPGKLHLTIGNHATWQLSESEASVVHTLNLNEGNVILNETLMVNDLTGNLGTFISPLDASTNERNTNKILIWNDFTGKQWFDLHLSNAEDPRKAVGSVLAYEKEADNTGVFMVKDEAQKLFWRHIKLEKITSDDQFFAKQWEITAIDTIENPGVFTPLANAMFSSGLANYATFNGLFNDTLHQRLGNLRTANQELNGLWVRHQHTQTSLNDGLTLKMPLNHWEIGYDRTFSENGQRVFWGGSLNWDENKVTLENGNGIVHGLGLSLYRTALFDNGWYIDAVARMNRYTSNATIAFENATLKNRISQWGYSMSVEGGKTIPLKDRFFVEPQAQVTLGWMTKGNSESVHYSVEQASVKSLTTRLGVHLGYRTVNAKGDLYLHADVLHQWLGKNQLRIAYEDQKLHHELNTRGTAFKLGIGGDYRFTPRFSVYGDVMNTLHNQWGNHWMVNVGARYRF